MAISLSMARPGCQRYKPSVMTLALAGLALVLAGAVYWLARRLREVERRLGELRGTGRQNEASRSRLERQLAVTRAHLADVVAGEPPPRDVIERGAPYRAIEPAPAMVLYQQQPDLYVLDVRTPAEFNAGHIPRAHSIPLDELEDRLGELPPTDRPVLVTCAAGGRATSACGVLAERGWTRLLNLAGGMHAWPGPRERDADIPPPAPPPADTGTSITFRGGPVSESQVVAAIRECYDPEIPINIYDLGLVYGIDIDESQIAIRMTLTSEGCPSARQIPEDVKKHVEALGQPNVSVDVVFEPPWHPARISPDGKAKLGLG
jgi:metal-sulfur cluster biosynthetic enzyme/rhodanese-related sulfurtransferase